MISSSFTRFLRRFPISSVQNFTSTTRNSFSTASVSNQPQPKTAILMLNMGGPATLSYVGPFLKNLFSDKEIIDLGRFQSFLGPILAKRRTPEVTKQYALIGNGSPILKWTELQGVEFTKILDSLSPSTAPHRHFIAFRYTPPFTEESLLAMKSAGITRLVAFSQYPQFSCTTSGSSFNHLYRELKRLNLTDSIELSLIDRWFSHPSFISAVCRRILSALEKFPISERSKAILLFSAHSLPQRIVDRGDSYPIEVAATVELVMSELRKTHGIQNVHQLSWQSQVGPLPWLGPKTSDSINGFAKRGHRSLLVVPIAFTSDHIETLFELDIENAELAKESGIQHFHRAESMNDEPMFLQAQAEIVAEHLKNKEKHSNKFKLNCPQCVNPDCRKIAELIYTPEERKRGVY